MTAAAAPVASTAPLRATVSRDDMLAALRYVEYGIAGRSQLPILTAVLLDAHASGLRLRTFDYEVECVQDIAAPQASGIALVSGRMFREMISALPVGVDVTLTGQERLLEVTAGGISYTLPLFKHDEFPGSMGGSFKTLFTCDGTQLSTLAEVCAAAGADDTLPVLTGIYLTRHHETGLLTAAATDRYRLAVMDTDIAPSLNLPERGLLVPARSVRQMARWFAKDKKIQVSVAAAKNADLVLRVRVGSRQFTQRLLDGEFPKYRSLLPEKGSVAIEVGCKVQSMLVAVQQAAIGLGRSLPVRLHLDDGKCELRTGDDANRDDLPTAVVPVPDIDFHGEAMVVAYNPRYLRDGFRVFGKDDHVVMGLTSPTKPALFTSEQRPGFTYLLMPVRLAG